MTHTINALANSTATLGESPVWSAPEQALYWVDINGRAIHRRALGRHDHQFRLLDGRPGSIALTTEPGQLLVASEHQILRLDWRSGSTTPVCSLEAPGTGNRLNDGRCDPAGRFVVGSMFADSRAGQTTGVLHQLGLDGTSRPVRHNVGVSNGLAFDAERRRMYFADTPTEKVLVFDYDQESGEIANERLFFNYSGLPGKPDGACVDAEGCYWSASVYGWAVVRLTPNGVIDRRIELPVEKPSMPCFGGPDLQTLFVTTIGAGGTAPSTPGRDGFEPGTVLRIDGLGVTGIEEPRFAL